jgi:hypothetical protein
MRTVAPSGSAPAPAAGVGIPINCLTEKCSLLVFNPTPFTDATARGNGSAVGGGRRCPSRVVSPPSRRYQLWYLVDQGRCGSLAAWCAFNFQHRHSVGLWAVVAALDAVHLERPGRRGGRLPGRLVSYRPPLTCPCHVNTSAECIPARKTAFLALKLLAIENSRQCRRFAACVLNAS